MRITATAIGSVLFSVGLILVSGPEAVAQSQPQPLNHVVIPNPTPRPPDLKSEYDNSAKDQEKQKELLIQSQLRAREIWLESNQLLLLAQQLDQQTHSADKPSSMAANAAKVDKIQKLARSIQEKMESH